MTKSLRKPRSADVPSAIVAPSFRSGTGLEWHGLPARERCLSAPEWHGHLAHERCLTVPEVARASRPHPLPLCSGVAQAWSGTGFQPVNVASPLRSGMGILPMRVASPFRKWRGRLARTRCLSAPEWHRHSSPWTTQSAASLPPPSPPPPSLYL
ncbi:MAG: hypothetical protein LBK99_07275 [Opitutaceae bacterium]|nr:hypothetical protein [Opitutaceae bacterium]